MSELSSENTSLDLPPQREEEIYLHSIYGEARALLTKFLPQACPKEPTVLIDYFGDPSYIGKFKGIHYIFMPSIGMIVDKSTRVLNPIMKGQSVANWRSIFALSHELIHQRQAENYQTETFGKELKYPRLIDADPTIMDQRDIKTLLIEAQKYSYRTVDDKSLLYPIIEGGATLGELFVINKVLESSQESGDLEAARRIEIIKKEKVKFLFSVKKSSLKQLQNQDLPIDYITQYDGIFLLRKLYKEVGLNNIPELLRNVDLSACVKIVRGSSEYQDIINDPRKLPRLGEEITSE